TILYGEHHTYILLFPHHLFLSLMVALPNFNLECQIRSAKLISQAFISDPPFWTKQLNQFTITNFSQSLPSCILNHRGTRLNIEPLHSFLNSSRLIETLSPFTIPSSPP